MYKDHKVISKYFLVGLLILLSLFKTAQIKAKSISDITILKTLTVVDTTAPTLKRQINLDTLPKRNNDTAFVQQTDSGFVPTIDSLKISKDSLDAPVSYEAEDSAVLVIPTKKFLLYGKAKTQYRDMNLEAGVIKYDQQTQTMSAYGGVDTINSPLNNAKFTQGASTSISDTIFFNLKTQKGLTKNTYYQEGEIFVNAERVKKVDREVAYAYRSRFTTCNLDTPHFAFRTRKMKLINNKLAVSGPAFPEFEGVPMPVGVPFGIYPLNRGRHSGFLPPQFATNEDFGLGLEGLGFYKVLSDNLDVTIRSNIYTYGGYSITVNPRYLKRYKYNGNFNFAFQKTKILNRGGFSKEEFTENKSFFVTWSHAIDTRARPGTNFSANVNAGSTKFNSFVPNNAYRNFQNQLSSSIAYSKTWEQGKYNLTVSANHNQNNNLGLINLNLPTVTFTANTFYPFQQKEQVGAAKWYEKLGISYNGNVLNQFSFYDSAFSFHKILDTLQWGAQHNIPITLSLPALGPLILAPSISYSERWFGQKITLSDWNSTTKKIDTSIQKGFYTAREMQMGLSANTRIFGTFNFGNSGKVQALRHEIKPFIGLNYKPDLVKQHFKTIIADSAGRTFRYAQLNSGVLGSFGEGTFGGLSFGIDNLLEMKVRDKKDTAGGTKKIRLIDGLSINSAYNFFADSLKLSPFSISFRSTLFEKVNITGNATVDPYQTDSFGQRINRFTWDGAKLRLGRFTGGSLAISTSLQSKTDGDQQKESTTFDPTLTPDEQQRQLDYVRQNPAEFVDFDIPWNVQLSFSMNFARIITPDLRLRTETNANLNVNGDFSLTPKWKIGGGTYFDFKTAKIQTLSLFVTRDMHCWQMAINITPVGQFRSFNITLSPKSGLLRDLRINRSRYFYN